MSWTQIVYDLHITKKKLRKMHPVKGSLKFKQSWTHIIYEKFIQKNPCCTLVFKYYHIKGIHSRKQNTPFCRMKAVCSFKGCSARYIFLIRKKPLRSDQKIPILVTRIGWVTHCRGEFKSRPASYLKRGKIGKSIHDGISNTYYRNLQKTPVPELLAGNITRSLSKNILKVISCEIQKSKRLHDDVVLELILIQKILKETDQNYKFWPGYIQHLQVDPFGIHLYTETGLFILVHHLRKGQPITLHLDATGGVVSKIPNQPKRVFYYSITLPGNGTDKPPLPVSELLTNDHTIPNLCFWLLQMITKARKLSKYSIHQIEVDYSWALIQSVLLAFNRQDIVSYLRDCYNIVKGTKSQPKFEKKTILHLCSAHIIKAIHGSFGKKTSDKGLKEFATHCVAQLINSTNLQKALHFFKNMCIVFQNKTKKKAVENSLKDIQKEVQERQTQEYTVEVQQFEDDKTPEANTIFAQSPFQKDFSSVLQSVMTTLNLEEEEEEETINIYYCPEIVHVLMKDYIPIYPLWSGVMLGDLGRHSNNSVFDDSPGKHDTNCHAENWFCILKTKILQKKLYLRPADFIQKMNQSLQGRYREHILRNELPERLLEKSWTLRKPGLEHSEERWSKKTTSEKKERKTKYFDPPLVMPTPKEKALRGHQGKKRKLHNTDSYSTGKNTTQATDESDRLPSIAVKQTEDKTQICKDDIVEATDESDRRPSSAVKQTENKTKTRKEDIVEALWNLKNKEIVVAVITTTDKDRPYTLHLTEFKTLKPHSWLAGETMEVYLQMLLNTNNCGRKIFLLNHYSAGVIVFGDRSALSNHSYRKVSIYK
ncbi:uncharacterized protein LOC112158246 [Oryzias melastigma]|uniref:uncharacterized protein LOC112158246 n=1 Tax=Oryzias melastigma TaxID=30732 RepID=UPI00168D8D1B|nr:uncharacterized protein LOC112158246 [Oryzias melastigma]